jgi:outer membrane protein
MKVHRSARRYCALLSLAALALVRPAPAADLLQVYRDAAAYDAQFAAARSQLDAVRQKVPEARSALLPSLTLSAGVSHTKLDARYDEPFPPLLPARDSRDFGTSEYRLQLAQPLLRRQSYIRYDQADYLVQRAEAAFDAARQDLILRAAQAYFDVLDAQDALRLARAQKAAIAEQLAQAKQRFQVGTATIIDTREAQARYDLVAAQQITIQNDLNIKRRVLYQLTGKDYGELPPLREKLSLQAPAADAMQSWVDIGERQGFPVLAQQAQLEFQALEVKRNRADHYPTLDFVASYDRTDAGGSTVIPVGSRLTTGIIGLQFKLPLYAGGATLARTREAAALLDKARADLENVRRQQALAVQRSFLNEISSFNQVQALEQALVSSQSALASNKLGYQVGVRINIDVLNAQQQVYSTQRELLAARYSTILNQLRLQAAVGGLDENDVEQVNRALAPASGRAH